MVSFNYNFGKLLNGATEPIYAPKSICRKDGRTVLHPTSDDYLSANDGPWLPVKRNEPIEPPPEGKHYEAQGWAADDATITRVYALVDDPPAAPRRWTPLSIKRTVASAGYWDVLKAAMEQADKYDEFVMAQYITEDDESYLAMRSAVVAIAGSEEAADALIAQIPQEV